jgi:outer membrane receptor protein involved in Fe transport
MLDHKFWGDRVKFIYGARLETYRQRLTSARAGEPVSVDVTWQDLLPSATAIINATDKLVIRANASQTVSRPEFRELAPLAFYEVNYNVIAVGNDTLKRTRITNLDLKGEYYFDNGAMVAINPFFKYFRDPIETEIRKQSFSLLNYLNTKEATNMGIELEARLPLSFVDTLFGTSQGRHFSLFGNYAYIFSRVNLETGSGSVPLAARPLQGQSPYLINAGLQYQNEDLGLDVQLSYNHIGRRIVFTNAAENGQVWENPRDLLDLSVSQKLYKGLTGRFVMGDILAQPLIWYQDLNLSGGLDDTDLRQFQFQNGRTFSVSLNYSF